MALNNILVPLICEQNQSIHQAIINNKNKIMHSDKTIYKLIDLGLLEVKNIDLPRKVRFRERRKETAPTDSRAQRFHPGFRIAPPVRRLNRGSCPQSAPQVPAHEAIR